MTAEPENIKAILASQFTSYGKGKPFHKEWSAFLGDSIFTTDLDQWHNSRQLLRPQFIKDRVSDLDVFEQHVQVLMEQMTKVGGDKGEEFDISDLFFRYTLDAATHFLLGRSTGSLEDPKQEFAEAFSEVQRIQSTLSRTGFVSPSYFIPIRTNKTPDPSTASSPAQPSTKNSKSSTNSSTPSSTTPYVSRPRSWPQRRNQKKATPSSTPSQASPATAKSSATNSSPSCSRAATLPLRRCLGRSMSWRGTRRCISGYELR